MVILAVSVSQPEHEPRVREVTRDTDDRTVDGATALHLDPFALTCQVAAVRALGDHALDARQQLELLFGLFDRMRLCDELQTRDVLGD